MTTADMTALLVLALVAGGVVVGGSVLFSRWRQRRIERRRW